jgi:Relaxase/Mobilisation nuclease domain
MIAKITKGSGFGGVVRYVLDPDKNPIMIAGAKQCWGNNASDIASELTKVAKFRPTTKLPVRHFSIGFGENDKLTDDIKTEIVMRIMEEMGYSDCQYFAVAHDRYDPNHHEVHDHDHLHIVANAITPHGERITDFKDYYRMELCLRKIEKAYGLESVHNSWEKVKKLKEIPAPSELKDKIDKALEGSHSLQEWLNRLEAEEVNVRFRITSRGRVQGISYVHQGELKKGSNVGHGWRDLSSRFNQTPENLELIRGANLKTQSLSIELKPEDQALLTKAADLAMQKLGGEDKFKDKSVQISIVDDVLKVRRLRPNKIILSAKKNSEGEWQSIGVPNIDAKKDLKILESVGKVEVDKVDDLENVEVLENLAQLGNTIEQTKPVGKIPNQNSHKVKTRRRSNELG